MDIHPTKNGINRYWSIPTSWILTAMQPQVPGHRMAQHSRTRAAPRRGARETSPLPPPRRPRSSGAAGARRPSNHASARAGCDLAWGWFQGWRFGYSTSANYDCVRYSRDSHLLSIWVFFWWGLSCMFVWQLGTRAKVDGMRKYFSDTPIDNFRVGLNVDWRLWVMGVVTGEINVNGDWPTKWTLNLKLTLNNGLDPAFDAFGWFGQNRKVPPSISPTPTLQNSSITTTNLFPLTFPQALYLQIMLIPQCPCSKNHQAPTNWL